MEELFIMKKFKCLVCGTEYEQNWATKTEIYKQPNEDYQLYIKCTKDGGPAFLVGPSEEDDSDIPEDNAIVNHAIVNKAVILEDDNTIEVEVEGGEFVDE